MKKIFTLFLTTLMMLTVWAAPSKLQVLDAQSAKEVNKDVVRKLVKGDIGKQAIQGTVQDGSMLLADVAAVKKVQKSETDTIELKGDGFLIGPEYDKATNEWYVALEAQGYTFRLCWYGKANTYCGDYTLDDMSMSYTWGWYDAADVYYEILLADITMSISEKVVSESLRQIILEATILDTEDRIYHLYAVHSMYNPKQTVQHIITNTQMSVLGDRYRIEGDAEALDVELMVVSDVVEGVFTHKELDKANTKVVYEGKEQEILQATLIVEAAVLEDGLFGYAVNFSFINQDTVLHQVSMPSPLPKVNDTIKIVCTDLDVDDTFAGFGFMNVSGSTDLYDVFALYEGTYAEEGVYDAAVTISDKTTWLDVQSISAKLTLVEGEEGWEANIEGYFADYNWYSVDMKFVIPEPTEVVYISFDSCALATYNMGDEHMLQLLNVGADYEASITVFGVKPGEEFTIENVLLDYSGVYDVEGEFTPAIADINGTLAQIGDTTIIEASIIGFNAIQYEVELWYVAPTAKDTVEIEMPIKFSNNLKDGYYTLSGNSLDDEWYIALSPIAEEVAGKFVNDGMFGRFGTGGQYDFFAGNTFVYSFEDEQNYPVEKGELIVNMAEDGTIEAEAKIICRNAVYFHIKMTTDYNAHLDFDEPEIEVDRNYTAKDNVTIDDQTARNGYIYLALTAADGLDMAAFFFYVSDTDDDIIIPEGMYPIDYSEEYGTVQANPGVQGNGVWPSFYAELMEDGSLVTPLWMMVRGTVEVTKDKNGNARLEVNAYNSYDVPVHIVYDAETTDLPTAPEALEAPATKMIQNSQLLIQKDGKVYDVVGNLKGKK